MPTIVRHGVRLHYVDRGAGPSVLWHTGGCGDGRMWDEAGYLAALGGCRHLVLDHRGHGRSASPARLEDHRIEEYVADVLAVLDHAEVHRAAFVGYSAGATVGIMAAASTPGRWSGLVTLGNVPVPGESPDESLAAAAHTRALGIRPVINALSEQEGEPAPAWLIDQLSHTDPEMYALLLDAWAPAAGRAWDDLHRIEAPTLHIVGGRDGNPAELAAAVARTPAARGVLLPDLGHLQSFWRTDLTAPLIDDFVSALPG